MQQMQPTTTITIDEVTLNVAEMSTNVQQLVQYLDDWRQKESEFLSDLLMSRSALKDLQSTLYAVIKEEQEATQETSEPPVEPAPVPSTATSEK